MSGLSAAEKSPLRSFGEENQSYQEIKSRLISEEDDNVKVICRFRPIQDFEGLEDNNFLSIQNGNLVQITGKEASHTFKFDKVYGAESTQQEVYDFCMRDSVEYFFKGYNGTILTYGQTGTGKSYTMLGPPVSDNDSKGIIPRMADEIFERIRQGASDIEYTLSVSFMEIYNDQINDLLCSKPSPTESPSPKRFVITEDKTNGITVKGLSRAFISSQDDLKAVLKQGEWARSMSSTNMNVSSSRSHAILEINLQQKQNEILKKSRFFLVDLAGSEKVDKAGSTGQALEETRKINSSLSALGNVINSLTDSKFTHIPYRDSKLTRILQDSLGGNARTSLIINCSPAPVNELETISTLRFGSRAKKIKNRVHINMEQSAGSLQIKLNLAEREINELKKTISFLNSEVASFKKSNFELKEENARLMPVRDIAFENGFGVSNRSNVSSTTETYSSHNLIEELDQRNTKISQLEDTILNMKMENLKISHQEKHKLERLENALEKLNSKLNEVEFVNSNLKKHLIISEKIIESRDSKIEKLKGMLREQQDQVSKESLNFENKLNYIKSKLELYSNNARESALNSSNKKSDLYDITNLLRLESESSQHSNSIESQSSPKCALHTSNPTSPKLGLNLNIVKPLRGGNKHPI